MDVLLLKATVVLAAALAGAWLLSRAPATMRHALWTAAFVSVLALPALSWTVPPIGIPVAPERQAVERVDTEPAVHVEPGERTARRSVPPPVDTAIRAVPPIVSPAKPLEVQPAVAAANASRWPRLTLGQALVGVWLTGFVGALVALIVSLLRVRHLATGAEELADSDWQAALTRASAAFGRPAPRLLVSSSVAVPMAGGVWRPTIFLPAVAREWSSDQREVVLRHESAHLAGWDPLRHLVARLALAVYWFHPLAWCAARQANAACEQACDQAVMFRGVLPSTYARVLLALAESAGRKHQTLAALPIVSRSNLERRLMAILDHEVRPPRRGVSLIIALTFLLTAGTIGPLATISVAPPEVQPIVIAVATELANMARTPAPAPPVTQQTTAPGPRAIAGRVVDRSTGQPVAGAEVRLSHQPPISVAPLGSAEANRLRMPAVSVVSDQDGRFVFDALPEGTFGISATRFGYRNGYFAQQSAVDGMGSNARIQLAAGERLTDITVSLSRLAAISGRVTNERGAPAVRASVQVFEREYIAGQPAWIPRRRAWQTNGQGEWGVPDLEPGDYLVALVGEPSAAGAEGYPSVFYPASPRASVARAISVAPGESRTGIDFLTRGLTSVARVVTVSGRVTAGGSPLTSMTLQLVPPDAEDGLLDVEALTAESSATGEFSFARVPVGEYRLLAFRFPPPESGTGFMSAFSSFGGFGYGPAGRTLRAPAGPTWVLDRTLTVDRPLENFEIPLQQGARIQGRVLFEGDGPVPSSDALGRAPVLVRPAHMRNLGRMPVGGVDPDGRFQTAGLPPGRYAISLFGDPRSSPDFLGWSVVSVRLDGRDITGKPIELGTTDVTGVELVLSNRHMQLSGVVRGTDGRPAPWGRAILFPRDPALWGDYVASPSNQRIRQIVADRVGAFDGAWVPAGDYLLAAVATVPRFWMAPAFLQTLVPVATPVRVELGGKQIVDLRLR